MKNYRLSSLAIIILFFVNGSQFFSQSVRANPNNNWATQTTENSNQQQNNTGAAEEITIGEQTWASTNLNTTTFRNGDQIPEAKTSEEWESANQERRPVWCHFENDASNGTKYGKIYNWYAIVDQRGLAPQGWHIPSKDAWNDLFDYLGGQDKAGYKLKSKTGWNKNGNGDNSSGFNALPGGAVTYGSMYGRNFINIGNCISYWTSTPISKESVSTVPLCTEQKGVGIFLSPNTSGMYVRCLKGETYVKKVKQADEKTTQSNSVGPTTNEWEFLENNIGITEIYCITSDKAGNVYISGQKTGNKTFIAKIDPEKNWTEIAKPNTPAVINIIALAADRKGNLYASVSPSIRKGNQYTFFVLKWDGNMWSELPDINAIPDNQSNISQLLVDDNDILYASGSIKSLAPPYNCMVSRWDGNKWEELAGLGNHMAGQKMAQIRLDSLGNVYALGISIHKWNGNKWTANIVKSCAPQAFCTTPNGNVYYVDINKNPGSFDVQYVVKKWNGSAESVIGCHSKSEFDIEILTSDSWGNIFLNHRPKDQTNYLLKMYDGKQINDFTNLKGKVKKIAFDNEGNIYAIGNFTNDKGEKKIIAKYLRKYLAQNPQKK